MQIEKDYGRDYIDDPKIIERKKNKHDFNKVAEYEYEPDEDDLGSGNFWLVIHTPLLLFFQYLFRFGGDEFILGVGGDNLDGHAVQARKKQTLPHLHL